MLQRRFGNLFLLHFSLNPFNKNEDVACDNCTLVTIAGNANTETNISYVVFSINSTTK